MADRSVHQPALTATNRRRQHYIKPSFQLRFILQFCILMVLGCLAFGAILYFYSNRTLTTAFVDSKLRVMSTADFLLPALGICTLAIAGVIAVISAARLLFLSHRIAGPLYRFEKAAQAIGGGNLSSEVSIRADDELQDVARSMDGMVADLRARVTQLQTQTRLLRDIIHEAKRKSTAPEEFLKNLEDTQGRLDEAISRFRV